MLSILCFLATVEMEGHGRSPKRESGQCKAPGEWKVNIRERCDVRMQGSIPAGAWPARLDAYMRETENFSEDGYVALKRVQQLKISGKLTGLSRARISHKRGLQ